MSGAPRVSVLVVSDYRAGEPKAWDDLRATLAALGPQELDEPVEHLLVETRDHLDEMPSDLATLLPGLRLIACDATGSYAMKNTGARAARGELLGVLDADTLPEPGWLRAGVEALRASPDAVAVSGRTTYPGRSTLERSLGLLSRAYVDRGRAGPVHLLSTNNMFIRREAFEGDGLPEDAGPFSYRMWTERLRRRGGRLLFEPRMGAVHDFEGWPMERDMRRGVGWTSIRIRQLDGSIPGAQVVRRLGIGSLPLFWAYRVAESAGHCVRLPRHFGLGWRHVPLLLSLAAVVHALELPGMLDALRDRDAGRTVYR